MMDGAETEQRKNVLLCVSGSVAVIKNKLMLRELDRYFNVRQVWTDKASRFRSAVEPFELSDGLSHQDFVLNDFVVEYQDNDDWNEPDSHTTFDPVLEYSRNDPILHVELRKWADAMIIAPLSANTLGKIANGICDNLLTTVARVWDFSKPMIVAPAMNTAMWRHPVTSEQIERLKSWGVKVVNPITKTLACGDTGPGALAEPCNIVSELIRCLNLTVVQGLKRNFAHVCRPVAPSDADYVSRLLHHSGLSGRFVEGVFHLYPETSVEGVSDSTPSYSPVFVVQDVASKILKAVLFYDSSVSEYKVAISRGIQSCILENIIKRNPLSKQQSV